MRACERSLTVLTKFQPLDLTFQIDGVVRKLPVYDFSEHIQIYRVGRQVAILTTCGVRMRWDGNARVVIKVPAKYKSNMVGLCGDCNGKKDEPTKPAMKLHEAFVVKDTSGKVGK